MHVYLKISYSYTLQLTSFLSRALPLKNGGDHTLAILCSSGSTGLPKGVTISHKAMLTCDYFNAVVEDRVFSFSTLYWFSGFATMYIGIFHGACRIITNKPFSSDFLIDLIENLKVSYIIGPPSQMALLIQNDRVAEADFSSVNTFVVGGSAVPFPVIEKVRKAIPNCDITVMYGTTELGGPCTSGLPISPNANGRVKENTKMKIVDEDGNKLGVGEIGEILVQTPYKWNGYYGDKEATLKSIDDGWYKSGDLGFFDADGILFVVDRKKEILKYQNFHYFPTEIELVIQELPDVVEVCVCGLPDLIMTDLPAAVVVKKPGSTLCEKKVMDHVACRMDHYKHLRGGVYFVDKIPKTISGKNVRKEVKNLVIQLASMK